MAKHRKKQHYRRMVIAAVVVGAVGVPTAAMACGEWPGGETPPVGADAGTPANPVAGDYIGNFTTPGQMFQAPAPAQTGTPTPTPTQAPAQAQAQPGGAHHLAHHRKHHWTHHRKHVRPGGPSSAPSKTPTAAPTAQRTSAPAPAPKATTSPSTPKASAPASAAPAASGVAARIVALVNAERAKVGCSALTLNPTLTKVAQAHSQDMAAHQNMSHTGSDGSSPGDRITGAGYDWSTYGENVAYGYGTPEAVMAGWMSSPGHRANILNCAFKEIGVGLAQPNSYWTQDFGTAR
ncbi:CAP domain-containing protein [Streptomyces sp. IBSBF 3136]|uniref:CAP domain-containing protein n=1 Tax=Streptomyces sp. IBSBF 3136 TaxID=2903524 RepID=UPI002FDBF3CC